jgi:hypothetical protein
VAVPFQADQVGLQFVGRKKGLGQAEGGPEREEGQKEKNKF